MVFITKSFDELPVKLVFSVGLNFPVQFKLGNQPWVLVECWLSRHFHWLCWFTIDIVFTIKCSYSIIFSEITSIFSEWEFTWKCTPTTWNTDLGQRNAVLKNAGVFFVRGCGTLYRKCCGLGKGWSGKARLPATAVSKGRARSPRLPSSLTVPRADEAMQGGCSQPQNRTPSIRDSFSVGFLFLAWFLDF